MNSKRKRQLPTSKQENKKKGKVSHRKNLKENKTKLKVKKDVKVKEPKAKKPKIDKSNPNWKLKPNLSINVYEKVNEYIIIYLSEFND